MDILSRWVQGKGIADRTWRGLNGVLRIHCPGLAQDIEEALRAENDTSESVPSSPFPPLPLDLSLCRPSLNECFSSVGIPVECSILDRTISGEEHIADIAKMLTKWRDLFPYFGLEDYQKEEIEAAGDISEQKRKLLTIWTQKLGPRATYRHLCTILWRQGRVDLIEVVCEVVKSIMTQSASREEEGGHTARSIDTQGACEAGVNATGPNSTLACFSQELRDFYAEHTLPYYFDPQCYKWMPNVTKEYIHPDIISKEEQENHLHSQKKGDPHKGQWRVEGRDNQVQLAELLDVRSGKQCTGHCVLVEGGPGMGKSTLAWQVCRNWGQRELFNQYSIVLLLPLRDKEVQQAKEMEDLISLHLKDKKALEEVKQEIGDGRDLLVILDGLDELPGHFLSKKSIFTDLISGKVLSDATILITSRSSATQQLQTYWKQRISNHFVICGFTIRDIEMYTKSVLSEDELTEFNECLSIHPHIQSIMYVPLHSAIVMAVYLQHKQLPKTLTQLYEVLVQTILSQYLDDHTEYDGERETSYAMGLELPKPVHATFTELCKIAFETVCKQELIFTDKTMPKGLHNLGFTDCIPGLYMHRSCSYNFLHLSIQEFLAAYHVSLFSPKYQEELLLRSREEHHFQNMMRFVAGLTKFEGVRMEAVKYVVQLKEKGVCFLDGYSLELLYECQNVILDNEDIYLESHRLLSHQYLALGYCIANSTCTWELELSDLFISDVKVEMLIQGLHDNKTPPAYTIKLTSDMVDINLLTRAPEYFTKHIESLTFSSILSPWNSNLIHFYQWLPTLQLKMLTLLKLQPDTIETVSKILTTTPSLKKLALRLSKFTLQSMQAFASMLQQNRSLTEVDISECFINEVYDADCICCLVRVLHTNTTLRVLDLGSNPIQKEGALAMAVMLKFNTALTNLNMSLNSVDDEGAQAIAEMLKHNSTLRVLDLSQNSIGEEGAIAMAEMLRCNTTLTVLDVHLNTIGERGAIAVAKVLGHNTTLTVLDMSGNPVCEWGVITMAEMLRQNTTLTELHMSQTSIGVEGARAMAEMLEYNTTLTVLNISENTVGIEGALAMAEIFKLNATLTALDISHNAIGAMGAEAMAEALKYNATVTVLDMSGNFVAVEGALAMAEMLKFNTTLESLHIIDFTIDIDGTEALVESLAVNHHLTKLLISDMYKRTVEALLNYNEIKERVIYC